MSKRKMSKVESHGTIYYLKGKTLCGCPLVEKGGYDAQACYTIEESPRSFKAGHRRALKNLGISKKSDVEKILTKIEYY